MNATPMQAREIFLAAVKMSPEAWRPYLAEACGGDDELRQRVSKLLQAHQEAGSFLAPDAPLPGATVDDPVRERPGTVIGPYKLLEQIGEGGFGVVFMAEQSRPLCRKVALKVLKPGMDTRQVIARFEAERQALALMDHPNIAHVHDGGETASGRPYFVMELVKGIPITEFCDQSQLSVRERLELFLNVCQAVQHAHQKGIIHRDFKPSNILVTLHDGTPVVKVIDFGIAKATGQSLTDKTVFTGFAQMIGTPLYMSPEQAALSGLDVDTRSDIYALGVLLYELLTGTTPFDKERLSQVGYDELRRIIREEEPPRPSARISTLGQAAATVATQRKSDPKQLSRLFRGELDWIVMKALEKDRNRRYDTASAFAADVQRYLNDEPVQACPPSAWYRWRKFARRNRGRLATTAVLALALLVAVGGVGWALLDRQVRRARSDDRIALILEEVDRLEREQRWPEAEAAARQAEAIMTGGEAGDAAARRVAEALRELAFIANLDRIRQERLARAQQVRVDDARVAQDYGQTFRDYGVDVESLPTEETVGRLRRNPALAAPIAAALDDWVQRRRRLGEAVSSWKPLVAAARGLDRDPLRDRLRAAWGRRVTPELQADLRRLADAIDVKAERPATLYVLGITLQRAQLSDVALRVIRDGQYAHPGDLWLAWEHAYQLRQRKDYAGAVRYCSIVVALRPDSAGAHLDLGVVLYDQRKLPEAEKEFREALCLRPDYPEAHNNLGLVLRDQRKLPEAEKEYREALRLRPDFALAHINLGNVLRDQRKLPEAEKEYREALRLRPHNPEAHNNLGIVLYDQRKLTEAEKEFREALRLRPDNPEAHNNLGSILHEQRKLPEAEKEFREALRLRPDNREAHNNLGSILHEQRKLPEAEKEYREALRLRHDFPEAHCGLGLVLRDQQKLPEAEKELREALRLRPDYPEAHCNLGNVLYNQRKLPEAEKELREALRLRPDYPEAHVNLGVVLYDQRKLPEAEKEYREAHACGTTSPRPTAASALSCATSGSCPRRRRSAGRRCACGPTIPRTTALALSCATSGSCPRRRRSCARHCA
jgi:serine/threonine-protein kinase